MSYWNHIYIELSKRNENHSIMNELKAFVFPLTLELESEKNEIDLCKKVLFFLSALPHESNVRRLMDSISVRKIALEKTSSS